jgi:hypothetical protein
MRGSDEVTAALLERCGTELRGTTPDGLVTVEEVECLAACDGAPVVQVNYENYERVSVEEATALADALLRDEVPPPTFAAAGSVTEPSSAAAYWRLAGLGEPPSRLTGRPEPEPVPASALPDQPVAPTDHDDPTTRTAEELRTGVDHGGAPGGEPQPAAATDNPEAQEPEPAAARRGRRSRKAADVPSAEDAAAEQEAEAPQRAGRHNGRRRPRGEAHEQAGPHEREAPGGEPQ